MENLHWLVKENHEVWVVFLNWGVLSKEIIFSEVKCWVMWYQIFPRTGSSMLLRSDLLRFFLEHLVVCLFYLHRVGDPFPFGKPEL